MRSRVISLAETEFIVPINFINRQDPALSFVLLVDQLELDSLTIAEAEERLIGRFPGGILEVTESYYSSKIDPMKEMRFIQMASPLYWELKQKIHVEIDSKVKIDPKLSISSSFWLNIRPRMTQQDFYDQVEKQTKLHKNSFYLTLVNKNKLDEFMAISRNSSLVYEPQQLVGCKLMMKNLSAEPSTFIIQVKGSQNFELKVSPSNTIRELKELIDINIKMPCSAQRVIYDSITLTDDNETLEQLGLKGGEMIKVFKGSENSDTAVNESTGPGRKFVNLHNPEGPEKLPWSKSAPDWRIVEPGLSLEGKCTNPQCKANDKWVIINKKAPATYDIIENSQENFCPICRESVEVELCAFNNCLYAYTGRQFVETGKKSVLAKSQERLEAGDEYNRYSPEKVGTARWSNLLICAFALPSKNKEKKICPHCNEHILGEADRFDCKHEYHPECKKHSQDLKTSYTTDCVLCTESSAVSKVV